jgi:predicted nucleotidyltransferase component of viral defense system
VISRQREVNPQSNVTSVAQMNDDKSQQLKPDQAIAIVHLARGRSASSTASVVGVAEQTIGVWKNEEAFAQALEAERQRVEGKLRRDLDEIQSLEQIVQRKALAVLNEALDSKEPGIAIRAAHIVRRRA